MSPWRSVWKPVVVIVIYLYLLLDPAEALGGYGARFAGGRRRLNTTQTRDRVTKEKEQEVDADGIPKLVKLTSSSAFPKERWGPFNQTELPETDRLTKYWPSSQIQQEDNLSRPVPMQNKIVGPGVGARNVSGVANAAAGWLAYQLVYRNYLQYKHQLRRLKDKEYKETTEAIYEQNLCQNQADCYQGTHCVLGVCECNHGNPRRNGSCEKVSFPREDCSPFPQCAICTDNLSCQVMDVNLVCANTSMIKLGTRSRRTKSGNCQCRENMVWNEQHQQCQVMLDADCSKVLVNGTSLSWVVEEAASTRLDNQLTFNHVGLDLRARVSQADALSDSTLPVLDFVAASEDNLLEAYCYDVERVMAGLSRALDARPRLCPPIPRSESSEICAMAFDSHDCSGGWRLNITDGASMDFPYSYFSSFWMYRNDIDTVGVRAGCTLTVYSSNGFKGMTGELRADASDTWWILEEDRRTHHLANDIESLHCSCNKTQIIDLFY